VEEIKLKENKGVNERFSEVIEKKSEEKEKKMV